MLKQIKIVNVDGLGIHPGLTDNNIESLMTGAVSSLSSIATSDKIDSIFKIFKVYTELIIG